jgi:DNA-binding NarL/FixJ family response regulator
MAQQLAAVAASEQALRRVVIADDSFLMREAILQVIDSIEGVEVVAECRDGDALWAAALEHDPDVVVTDIRMPPSDADEGLQVAQMLRRTQPGTGVVVLSQFSEPEYGLALLEQGSDGRAYLLKEHVQFRGQLVSAIESVARGGSMIDATVVEGLINARANGHTGQLGELTPRELEILSFVARGHSNQAIADELFLTKRAVEKHINAIFLKLGLSSAQDVSRRVKAALIYLAEKETV